MSFLTIQSLLSHSFVRLFRQKEGRKRKQSDTCIYVWFCGLRFDQRCRCRRRHPSCDHKRKNVRRLKITHPICKQSTRKVFWPDDDATIFFDLLIFKNKVILKKTQYGINIQLEEHLIIVLLINNGVVKKSLLLMYQPCQNIV
jgi:hypothetical protein